MTLLHYFILITEPIVYLRFSIMDDWGCCPFWYIIVDTLFFPVKPFWQLFLVTIQLECDGKIISKDINDLETMCCTLSDRSGIKTIMYGVWMNLLYIFSRFTMTGRNAETLEGGFIEISKHDFRKNIKAGGGHVPA